MSGEAVLNILNSTRFTEKFRDFNWAELSDRASEAYNRQGMHLALIRFNMTSIVKQVDKLCKIMQRPLNRLYMCTKLLRHNPFDCSCLFYFRLKIIHHF